MAKFLVTAFFQYRQILRHPGEVVEIEKRDVEFFTARGAIRPVAPKAAPKPVIEKPAEPVIEKPAAPAGRKSRKDKS